MTTQPRPSGLGYESPTEHTAGSALVANHLIHRLNDLDRNGPRNDQGPRRRQQANVDQIVSEIDKETQPVSIKDRIACFRWTWFTSTMATGGIANVIASGGSSWPFFSP